MASEAAAGSAGRDGVFRRHRWKVVLLAIVVIGGGLFALYTAAVLSFSYSQGDRIGYVQKLSKKGWLCRTWEGELAMTQIPGAPPVIFEFSIRNDDVAAKVAAVEGKRVALQYEQKIGLPTRCFGETQHFITDVRVVSP